GAGRGSRTASTWSGPAPAPAGAQQGAVPTGCRSGRGSRPPAAGIPSGPGVRSRLRLLALQLLHLVGQDEGVDNLVQVPLKDRIQPVERQPDTVVGHTPLGKVVGADALAALAGAHLRAAGLGQLLFLRPALHVQKPRPEHPERLFLVLQLRALVLAGDDQPR